MPRIKCPENHEAKKHCEETIQGEHRALTAL